MGGSRIVKSAVRARPRRRRGRVQLAAGLACALLYTEASVLAAAAAGAGQEAARYIVTFSDAATDADVAAARARAGRAGATVVHDYTSAVRGFAAALPAAALAGLRADPLVAAVEADQAVAVTAAQGGAPGGLDRIDERTRPLDGRFRYAAGGRGSTIYVIDTGIRAGHDQFGGRVSGGYSAVSDGRGTRDCNGHGTYVAGLAAGSTYGVAKRATLVPVRVMGCDGSGSIADVIAGVDWVTRHHDGPSVANVSAGTRASDALDRAVRKSIESGVTYVIAAGNDGRSACRDSPGRVSAAITVGATTRSDARAAFSNYGSCVDIWAPGKDIRSASGGSDTATRTLSGTSSAAPLVAGAIAAYLEHVPDARPSAVRTVLLGAATRGRLAGLGPGSPNALLYSRLPTGTRAPRASAPSVALPAEDRSVGRGTVPVRVSWSGSDPDGDRIRSYTLQRSYDGGRNWTTVRTTDSDATTVDVRPDGDLRFRVRATDARGRTGGYAASRTMRLALRQQGDAHFSGSWSLTSSDDKSGGTARKAAREGASATFAFTGSRVAWIGTEDDDRGRAKVYVDGTYRGTVSEYASSRHARRVVWSATLAPGRHTVHIVLTGTHRSGATSAVEVDAFVVLD